MCFDILIFWGLLCGIILWTSAKLLTGTISEMITESFPQFTSLSVLNTLQRPHNLNIYLNRFKKKNSQNILYKRNILYFENVYFPLPCKEKYSERVNRSNTYFILNLNLDWLRSKIQIKLLHRKKNFYKLWLIFSVIAERKRRCGICGG